MALLTIDSARKDSKEMVSLHEGLCLVHMGGCLSKHRCLFHPTFKNVSFFHIVVGGIEERVHVLYSLRKVIYLLKIFFLEGGKLLTTGTLQCHGIRIHV